MAGRGCPLVTERVRCCLPSVWGGLIQDVRIEGPEAFCLDCIVTVVSRSCVLMS